MVLVCTFENVFNFVWIRDANFELARGELLFTLHYQRDSDSSSSKRKENKMSLTRTQHSNQWKFSTNVLSCLWIQMCLHSSPYRLGCFWIATCNHWTKDILKISICLECFFIKFNRFMLVFTHLIELICSRQINFLWVRNEKKENWKPWFYTGSIAIARVISSVYELFLIHSFNIYFWTIKWR